MRNAVIAAVMMLPAAAMAQNEQKMLYAQCSAGQGCECQLSNVTLTEAAVLLAVPRPQGEFTLVREGNALTLDPRSIDDLHRSYGGSGQCEIDLFPNEPDGGSGGIVPRDGLWQIALDDVQLTQCNPMVSQMLTASGVLNQPPQSHRIEWGGEFDPRQLDRMNEPGQRIEWRRSGPNSFTGEIFEVNTCQGADPCTDTSVDVSATITSPTTIRSETVLSLLTMMGDAGGMAEMQALGLASCRARMMFDMTHQSD
ncbi:hypothetical protein [Pontivivens insulae]|nr:hypothetical protein [Pontivivens insulae]